jgi:hypothetical protein
MIFIIGPNQNQFFLKTFLFFKKSKKLIFDATFPQSKNLNIKRENKFHWNKENIKTKLKVQARAFEVFENMNLKKNNLSSLKKTVNDSNDASGIINNMLTLKNVNIDEETYWTYNKKEKTVKKKASKKDSKIN